MNVSVVESFFDKEKTYDSIKEESKIALESPSFHIAQERRPHSQGRKEIFP